MVIHYQPERLRYNSDQPTAITNVLVATSGSSYHTGDIPLGTPTCSARTRQGRWALYPNGDEVVVVWPGGALVGPAVEVAQELNRLGDGRDDLDRAAVRAIRQFLTDPAAADAPSGRRPEQGRGRARRWATGSAAPPTSPAPDPPAGQPARCANIGPADPAARPQSAADSGTSRLTAAQRRKPASATSTAGQRPGSPGDGPPL